MKLEFLQVASSTKSWFRTVQSKQYSWDHMSSYACHWRIHATSCQDIHQGNLWRETGVMIVIMRYMSGEPISLPNGKLAWQSIAPFHYHVIEDIKKARRAIAS